MSDYTYQAIWECDPQCSIFRLMSLAKPELLDMLVEASVVPEGPVEWRHLGDRFVARVPVRAVGSAHALTLVTPDLPGDPDMVADLDDAYAA
jgi:hypothetical protein